MIKDVSLKVASKETSEKTIGKQRPDVSLINQYLFTSFLSLKIEFLQLWWEQKQY